MELADMMACAQEKAITALVFSTVHAMHSKNI